MTTEENKAIQMVLSTMFPGCKLILVVASRGARPGSANCDYVSNISPNDSDMALSLLNEAAGAVKRQASLGGGAG